MTAHDEVVYQRNEAGGETLRFSFKVMIEIHQNFSKRLGKDLEKTWKRRGKDLEKTWKRS